MNPVKRKHQEIQDRNNKIIPVSTSTHVSPNFEYTPTVDTAVQENKIVPEKMNEASWIEGYLPNLNKLF